MPCKVSCQILLSDLDIIDGNVLIQLVQWAPNVTYDGVIKQHTAYLLATFGPCIIVLDGCDSGRVQKILNIRFGDQNCLKPCLLISIKGRYQTIKVLQKREKQNKA